MRDLRDLTRSRTAMTQERARMIQRLEKVLQDAGIKLTSVASQAYSKSARAILDALVEGERDPKVLASLVKAACGPQGRGWRRHSGTVSASNTAGYSPADCWRPRSAWTFRPSPPPGTLPPGRVCPGNNASGGKRRSGRTRPGGQVQRLPTQSGRRRPENLSRPATRCPPSPRPTHLDR